MTPTGSLLMLMPVLVLCLVVLSVMYALTGVRSGRSTVRPAIGGAQSETYKRDCDAETVYSVSDPQCNAVCRRPATFVSRNGACVNVLALGTHDVVNKCDPGRGVLAFLVGDPQFGKTEVRCLSVDPGIQPDDPAGENIICVNGTADVDYVKRFPLAATDCRCTGSKNRLAFVTNTRVMREYGVCVSDSMVPLFGHNDLLSRHGE